MPPIGTVWTFDYTGGEQEFTTPCSGGYKLETWGAQGGSESTTFYGGYGGYSNGEINLKKNIKIYINIGGQGSGYSLDKVSAVVMVEFQIQLIQIDKEDLEVEGRLILLKILDFYHL